MKSAIRIFVVSLIWFCSVAWAADAPVLHSVYYQTSVDGWVKTNTALVTVSVDANVGGDTFSKTHNTVLQKLDQMTPGVSWHVQTLQRGEDRSGVNTLHVVASARLPEVTLSTVLTAVKKMSKTGLKFDVANVNFQPSLAQMDTVQMEMRQRLYKKVLAEVKRLNVAFPGQTYQVHRIRFLVSTGAPPVPTNMALLKMSGNGGSSSQAVMRKVTVTAQVELAAVQPSDS